MGDLMTEMVKAKMTLTEMAKQAGTLGSGLQNVAPQGPHGEVSPSVQYLLHTTEKLTEAVALVSNLIDEK